MFKVLSSFSALTFLGLTVKDWNFSGLAKRELFLYQDDAKWPCVLSPDSTVLRVSPSAYIQLMVVSVHGEGWHSRDTPCHFETYSTEAVQMQYPGDSHVSLFSIHLCDHLFLPC